MKNYLLILGFCLTGYLPFAQVEKDSELYRTIIAKDSLLFDVGFNTCAIGQFEELISEHFEFYHDKDGISDKAKFLRDLKNGLCSNPGSYQARRELLKQGTKIFALHDKGKIYGAIQEGTHQFFETQAGQAERFGSSARFTHVWLIENGEWKLVKSYSYEHVDKMATASPLFDNDREINEWLKENKIPTLGIGVIEEGKLSQVKVFGKSANGTSASYNTIFNVASLTKPVTAVVALKLAEQGKLNLDEPLYAYWTDPDIAKDPRNKKLTARLILSHQTGFANWRWLNKDEKLRFDFDPGKGYQYSGEGYEYLRKALENKFKKSLQQLAEELIFRPLKMNDTRYTWDKNIEISRYATGYDENGNAYKIQKNATPNAADDLLTTIEDYGRFLVSLLKGDLLSEKLFKEMTTPQVASVKGKHFGLGFEIYDLENGEYALAHGGADVGVRAIVFILPKTKQGLLIFTNSDTGGNVYEILIKHYLGKHGQRIIDTEMK